MSIALIIEEVEGKQVNEYVPVSTQAYFSDTWMKICKKSKFEWIPLFETGSSFIQDDLPYILDELYRFKDICKREILDEKEGIFTRILLLISNLEKLKGKNSKFTIG